MNFINHKIYFMPTSLDIRFSFLCRTSHSDKNGHHPIILRIIFRKERRDIFTGVYCPKESWERSTGRVMISYKQGKVINEDLSSIKRKANDAFDKLRFSGESFSIDEIVDLIKGNETVPELLIDFLEAGNQIMLKRVGVDIRKATYYKYRKSLEYMQEYLKEQYKVKNYLLNKVDTRFLELYFHFLRVEKKLSNNTAIKYIVFVKTIFGPALRDGTLKSDPFRALKLRKNHVYPRYLTIDELEQLQTLELNDEDLDRKRDIFLFACYTGFAYVDLKALNNKEIQKDPDGSFYIRKPRQKTGEESIVPLLPAAIRILQKYSLTGDVRDFNWYVSSNQKMNKGLKYIGNRANFSKELHMHMARHTFATTVTLSNGVPIESVSKMLGHANIRQTQHYAQVVALKVKNDMSQISSLFK